MGEKKVEQEAESTKVETEIKEVKEKKAFSLPMDDESDDWMNDDDLGGAMIEEDEDEDAVPEKAATLQTEMVESKEGDKKAVFSLPMDDDSDDWMLDDDVGAMIDEEDEEESLNKIANSESAKEANKKVEVQEPSNPEKKPFGLPLDDASDDWMLDDDVGTMMDEDEEEFEKAPPARVETAATEKKSFSRPLDDASDDWMIDDDIGAMIEEEEDSEKKEVSAPPKAPKVEKKEVCYSSSCLGDGNCYSPSCLALVEKKEAEVERKEGEKKSFSLPLDDASDD